MRSPSPGYPSLLERIFLSSTILPPAKSIAPPRPTGSPSNSPDVTNDVTLSGFIYSSIIHSGMVSPTFQSTCSLPTYTYPAPSPIPHIPLSPKPSCRPG